MREQNRKRNIWGRRITSLLLLCGLLLPVFRNTDAASVTYEYKRITDKTELPADNQWHDYFIAWEDLDDKTKVWYAGYHWYTPDGYNNYDAGGTHWMEYRAASTLPDGKSSSFTSKECLGHMQIKYVGRDGDNDNSPMYYIRVSKMQGGYSYFTRYEPTDNESGADAFTFQDQGDNFHIFVNLAGKADRYLTRDGQDLETTESSSYGGGDTYRPLRVYRRTYTIDETVEEKKDVIGKVTLYEYHWVNTVDELMTIANGKQWADIMLAWEDADGYGTTNPDKVWYTKEVWYEDGQPNYRNGANNEFYYWSNDCLGSDGYSSPYAESFILPFHAGHFQMKCTGWDKDNPVHGYTNAEGKNQSSPVFNFRFHIGNGKYIYIGNNAFHEDESDAEDYTVQLRLGRKDAEDLYGSVWIINNITAAQDELFTRCENRFDISNWIPSKYWEFPFRIYAYRPVEYDAIVKSFSIGKGATYSIDKQLIVAEGVTITVEDGGVLTVDKQLLNNGQIVVKNGGTVIVNEGGYIMAYDHNANGKITLDGGNLLIMDNAKVICDLGDGAFEAKNGATILNRGFMMVGNTLSLNNSSYFRNEKTATLLIGGRLAKERGGVDAFTFDDITSRVENESYTYLCSNKSRMINKGTFSKPADRSSLENLDATGNTTNIGIGQTSGRFG